MASGSCVPVLENLLTQASTTPYSRVPLQQVTLTRRLDCVEIIFISCGPENVMLIRQTRRRTDCCSPRNYSFDKAMPFRSPKPPVFFMPVRLRPVPPTAALVLHRFWYQTRATHILLISHITHRNFKKRSLTRYR